MTSTAAPPQRALAPDLARGLMLLFIAMANVTHFLWGRPPGPLSMHQAPASAADRVAQVLMTTFVDGMTYPLFAFLFGYGMVQFFRSRRLRGFTERQVSRMLLRRHLAMLAFGALHAALLFHGDVLGAYAVAALVFGPLLFRRSSTVVMVIWGVLSGLGLVVGVLGMVVFSGVEPVADPAPLPGWVIAAMPHYGPTVGARLGDWVFGTPIGGLVHTVPLAIWSGWLAARHRLLEDAVQHRRLLWTIVFTCLPLAWLSGLAHSVHAFGLPEDSFMAWTLALGVLAGPGYAALFALVAAWVEQRQPAPRRPVLVTAVAAVGQRSLSCYLWQSIVFAPVLSAWGLGLGGRLTTWSSLLFAAAVWAVSVVGAEALRRLGNRRGPFEVALRWLTYGRSPAPGAPRMGALAPDGGQADIWVEGRLLMPWDPKPPMGWFWHPQAGWYVAPMVPVAPISPAVSPVPVAPQSTTAGGAASQPTPVRPRE